MGPKNKNTRGASNTQGQDIPRTSQVVTIEDELDESIRQLDDHLKEVGVGSDSRKAVCEAQMTRNLNLVKKITEGLAAQQKQITELREHNSQLETRVKALETRDKAAQVQACANSVLIWTKNNTAMTSQFIKDSVEAGGVRMALKNFQVVTISSAEGRNSLFKVTLPHECKTALFKGLAHVDSSGFNVSNDVPVYLRKPRADLEKAAFTLRARFKEIGLKTKIGLKNLKLCISIRKNDHQDWFKTSDPRADNFLDTELIYKDTDTAPEDKPTCRQFIDAIIM